MMVLSDHEVFQKYRAPHATVRSSAPTDTCVTLPRLFPGRTHRMIKHLDDEKTNTCVSDAL